MAGHLGMTVSELEARMSIRELNEWKIREQIEPFGERRMDLRFALLAHIQAEANRDPKKRRRPYQLWEVFALIPEPPPPTPEQLVRKLQIMFGDPELDREHGWQA